jgi:hypothetical protein
MKSLKTLATGVGATMLATSMLTGFTAAAPKPVINPKMHVVAPKPVMIKPVRPMLARPHVKVRVNRDLLEKKADQDDDQADALPRSVGQPNGKKGVAAMLPPQRLPKPRPDFEDRAGDIADMAGIEGIGEIDPDALRVATNPHDPDGAFGGVLPGAGEDEQQAGSDPTGPFGRLGGDDSVWNDPRDGMGSTIPNPAGESSHGKDTPETAPGVRVTPGSIAAAMSGVAGTVTLPLHKETSGDRVSVLQFGSSTYTEKTRIDGSSTQTLDERQPDGAIDRNVQETDENGSQTHTNIYIGPDGEATSSGEVPVNELRNPDYAEGGGYVPVNCGSVGCNESRKGKPGLRLSDGMVRALTDPEHSAAGPRNGAAPIVTQHDLLSQYDPEFDGGGGPTPIDKPRIQSD